MACKDLRQYIEALQKTGDVVRIQEEVSWDLEVVAITAISLETYGPAVLFERIKDYPNGGRIFGHIVLC